MPTKFIPYFGNGAYCYANTTAMLLTSIKENISPSIIEVLSGVGLGAHLISKVNLLFFNFELPDTGIDNALKILGITCEAVKVSKQKPPPFSQLKKALIKSPVVIGPLDMGCLIYNPRYRQLNGADHYILVYKMTDKDIWLHDPAGFPCVSLSLENLKLAWQGDSGYCQDVYRYWTIPKRTHSPSQDKIYREALKLYKNIYYKGIKSAKNGFIVGKQAIMTYADRIAKHKFFNIEIGHLVYFALPLGAKRALDFSSFFAFKDKDLAELKQKQAKLFGQTQTFATTKNSLELAASLKKIAEIEGQFWQTLLRKTP